MRIGPRLPAFAGFAPSGPRLPAFALSGPLFVLLAACGGDSGDPLTVTTNFTVTSIGGSGTSPLDALANQPIDISIVWPSIDFNHGDGSDPAGCKTTAVYGVAVRTASGSTATLVQTEILDRLDDWAVRFQICDAGAGQPSITLDSTINELNLGFGCFGIPSSSLAKDSAGFPEITSFTASQCNSTILDVVNNRVLSNPSFSMTIATGPDQVP